MRSLMLLSMKMCLALVCGVSALFAVAESTSDSVSDASHNNSIAEPNQTTPRPISAHSGRDTQSATWNPAHKPADVSATVGTEGATDHSPTTAEAATASSSGQLLLGAATGTITAAGEAQTSPSTAVTKAAREQSPLTPIRGASSAASSATDAAASLPEPSSTTKPELASDSSSTDSPVDATQTPAAIQNFSSISASITSTGRPSSKGAPFSPVTLSEASTHSTAGLSSAPQPRSVATPSTVQASSNTGGSKSLTTTTKSTTAAPCEHTKGAASTDVQPCSNRVVVNHCLIVITSLAGLATIFMVSTIILCARLSTRKSRVKKPKQATEMMSFSALPPEMNYSYLRQRNPVTNRVLVMPNCEDSDEDGGDNLTLISFLPENDHFV